MASHRTFALVTALQRAVTVVVRSASLCAHLLLQICLLGLVVVAYRMARAALNARSFYGKLVADEAVWRANWLIFGAVYLMALAVVASVAICWSPRRALQSVSSIAGHLTKAPSPDEWLLESSS